MNYKRDEMLRLELEWYYNYSSADCGLKSNWCAMVNAAQSPGSSFSDPYNSFILRAVDKRRDIEKALWQLPSNLQNCLCSLFGSNHLPHSITALYGNLGGPAICTEALPIRDLEKLCDRKLLGKASVKDTLLISEIRIQAEDFKNKSITAYKEKRYAKQED